MDLSKAPSSAVSAGLHQVVDTPSSTPVRSLRRRAAERAVQFLIRHTSDGVRMADLSRVAGVSERTLRYAFRQEVGLSPKQFDIRERLLRARQALAANRDAQATVTSVAAEFGFFELGRFAKLYKQFFGELPSQTIKAHHAGLDRALLADRL